MRPPHRASRRTPFWRKKMRNPHKRSMVAFAALLPLGLALLPTVGCTTKTNAAGAAPPPEVDIAVVEQRDIPIDREWIGTLDGMVNAAIKAQVTGYLLTQNYTEGSFVRK